MPKKNPIAKDLRTPKYRKRVVKSKKHKPIKHKGRPLDEHRPF